MNNRLLFIDTETGGLDPHKHSLLTIGVVVWDEKLGELYSDEYAVFSDTYTITKSALRINHFNEELHREKAISSKEIVRKFHEIKSNYFQEYNAIPLLGTIQPLIFNFSNSFLYLVVGVLKDYFPTELWTLTQ